MERPVTSTQVAKARARSLRYRRGSLGSPALERPSEAQLMAVGIGNMEEALAPFRVARRRLDRIAGSDQSGIQPVYIRVVEDHAAPPESVPAPFATVLTPSNKPICPFGSW
jgi:hypothetical protein